MAVYSHLNRLMPALSVKQRTVLVQLSGTGAVKKN